MKKKNIFVTFGLILLINPIFAQFSDSDVSFSVVGLSVVNTQKFKDKKSEFIEALNSANLPASIKPMKVEIIYKENKGSVKLTINFDALKVYSDGSEYATHGRQFNALGTGISFYFQHQLLLCLSEYKFAVASDGLAVKKDLADFKSILTLKKTSGDVLTIYAFNEINDGYNGGGMYPYYFDSKVDMKISGKIYSTKCGNIENLDNMKYFFVSELVGLDGKKTGAYYFCKFFNVSTE